MAIARGVISNIAGWIWQLTQDILRWGQDLSAEVLTPPAIILVHRQMIGRASAHRPYPNIPSLAPVPKRAAGPDNGTQRTIHQVIFLAGFTIPISG